MASRISQSAIARMRLGRTCANGWHQLEDGGAVISSGGIPGNHHLKRCLACGGWFDPRITKTMYPDKPPPPSTNYPIKQRPTEED